MYKVAEYSSFLSLLRRDLGTRFTTAEEHTADPQKISVIVLRQRHDELLTVAMDTQWVAALGLNGSGAVRVEYKHLVVAIRNFFSWPDGLPDHQFAWPGTQETREEVRRALDPRIRRKMMPQGGIAHTYAVAPTTTELSVAEEERLKTPSD